MNAMGMKFEYKKGVTFESDFHFLLEVVHAFKALGFIAA
jgi:hypothetical protein